MITAGWKQKGTSDLVHRFFPEPTHLSSEFTIALFEIFDKPRSWHALFYAEAVQSYRCGEADYSDMSEEEAKAVAVAEWRMTYKGSKREP